MIQGKRTTTTKKSTQWRERELRFAPTSPVNKPHPTRLNVLCDDVAAIALSFSNKCSSVGVWVRWKTFEGKNGTNNHLLTSFVIVTRDQIKLAAIACQRCVSERNFGKFSQIWPLQQRAALQCEFIRIRRFFLFLANFVNLVATAEKHNFSPTPRSERSSASFSAQTPR